MNALDHLLSQPMLARMGWTLIHFLWQGAAIALLLGIALLLLRRSSASARHNAACAAMALLALLPAVTFAWLRPAVIAREATSNTVLPPGPIAAIHLIGVDTEKTPSVKTSASREPFVASIAACAWVIGIVLISAWRIGGYACLWLLIRRGSGPVDGSIEAVVARLCERMGVRRAVRLLESARVQTPAVVGWLRPMILVPASIMSGLSAAQLEAILAHELAHIRRHDYLVNVLQTAIETLFFYHPAVWWVSAQIREERENCCDDWAVKTCGDRLLYARALAAMEELRLPPAPFALAASGAPLLRRVRRLLGHQPVPVRLGAARPAISMFLVIACIALPMMASQLDAGDRAVSSDPTTRATATSPVQARNSAGATEVRREDLIPPPPIDYRVAANDLISVRIADLLAPGKETTMSRRVSETGVITLPYIGPLKVAGLTEAEVEQAIIAAYKQAGLIAHANVIVTIAEPQGRMFQILGAVDAPGVYPLRSNDTRLMDALATAKLTGQASQILVFRGEFPRRRRADSRTFARGRD